MKTLTLKTYSRAEIAEILDVNEKDPHFARKVKDTLQKWGYSYQYKRTQVTILKTPQTREERIAEIAQRELGLDTRINASAFAAFLFALQFNEDFNCSPWDKKVNLMKDMFNIEVSDRTLRSWTKKLIDQNIVIKDPDRELWCTTFVGSEKQQLRVINLENYNSYKQDMQTFLEQEQEHQNPEAWKAVYERLWAKYKVVYYWCKPFTCNALVNRDIKVMLELVEDLYIFKNDTLIEEAEETHIFD